MPQKQRAGRLCRNVAAVGFLLLTACSDRPGHGSVAAGSSLDPCRIGSSVSRWSTAPDQEYVRVAKVGDTDDLWFEQIGGIHASAHAVYVLDTGSARVMMFDHDLRTRGTFGRSGDGPGELGESVPSRAAADGGSRRWIDGVGDELVVFDGRRLSLFTTNGDFVRTLIRSTAEIGLTAFTNRIRSSDGTVLFAAGGYDPFGGQQRSTADGPIMSIRQWNEGKVHDVFQLRLPPLPAARDGVPFRGPRQALPLWDALGDCVALSDGSQPFVVVTSPTRPSVADTVWFELPPVADASGHDEEVSGLLAAVGGGSDMPEPTAVRRIWDMIFDPDGQLWILPAPARADAGSGIEVLRIALESGLTRVDTVPRFPEAFGPPGVYFATARDSLGQVLLEKYELTRGR